LQSLRDYRTLLSEVDQCCNRIGQRYAEHIACTKACSGNCCRIHLSIFAVEAFSLAGALQKLPAEKANFIKQKAREVTSFGPCPLLEDGACLMYDARLIICRTHGLPMMSEYRGTSSVGYCHKNFQNLSNIPDDAVIDLNCLNQSLKAVNRQFMDEFSGSIFLHERFTIGEALLIDVYA
jgi:Fe-S-cluster containining protein